MKKQLITVIILFAALNVFSQQEDKIKFGIKTGIAFTNTKLVYVNDPPLGSLQTKNGFILGCFLNISFSKNVVFQPSVLYVGKGYNNYYYYAYHYLEIPLNILYKTQTKSGIFLLGGGVSPAFILSTYSGNQIKKFDFGINVLAGYQLPIGFSINVGYTYGLLNLSNNKNYISNIQNKYLGLTVGYEF
jgi:hypothetical protein